MNHTQNNVIIVAHPRSGSTSLYKALNTHPDLNLRWSRFIPVTANGIPITGNHAIIISYCYD